MLLAISGSLGAILGSLGASGGPLRVVFGTSREPLWPSYVVPGPSDAVGSRLGGLSEPT